MKYLMVATWLIFFMGGINLSLHLISNPSSIENAAGLIILVVAILITVKTKFFIKFLKIWRK